MEPPGRQPDPLADIRAWFESEQRERSYGPRGPERRDRERRQLGVTARRADDAELNRRRRAFLLGFLQQLPPDTLWSLSGGALGSPMQQ